MKKNTSKKRVAPKIPQGWTDAQNIISSIRETPLQKSERGAAYVALAEVYLDTVNSVLSEYKKSLQETLENWDKLDTMGKAFEEKLSLAKIRTSLKK